MIRNPPFGDPPLTTQQAHHSFFERVPVEEITRRARKAHPGRATLAVIGGLLFTAGWAAAKLVSAAWLAMAWSGTAVQVGWQTARGTLPAEPDIGDVLAENARLRKMIERLPGEVPIPQGVA